MTALTVMVQGTGSSVGKSLTAAALCRIFKQDGYRVAPFKAQNMSLNSYVTADGAEIARSQVVQAQAAGIEPTADMNPVLLKPEVDYRSQLIVHGKPVGRLESKNFNRRKEGLWEVVTESLDRLRAEYDIVVIEGAGSPAEINLRQGDIVNMEVALYAQSPVLLVGDIDKGGVFASLYGTLALIAPEEKALVKGLIINKFRGDVTILTPGLRQIEDLTGVPVLGVVPYFRDIHIPEEDSPSTRTTSAPPGETLDVAVIALPHISNFDEFDAIGREPGVGLRFVRRLSELGSPDLLIIPGTKTTIADLDQLRSAGIADAIVTLATRGTPVVGVCGGFQMLGASLHDPDGVESTRERADGLGLLPSVTTFASAKETHRVRGSIVANAGLLAGAVGLEVTGYVIHMGATTLLAGQPTRPVAQLARKTGGGTLLDGLISAGGWVMGTYMHGLFENDALRRIILANVAARAGKSLPTIDAAAPAFSQDAEFDKLAALYRSSLDMATLYRLTGLRFESTEA